MTKEDFERKQAVELEKIRAAVRDPKAAARVRKEAMGKSSRVSAESFDKFISDHPILKGLGKVAGD
jgi:hypothetical protein